MSSFLRVGVRPRTPGLAGPALFLGLLLGGPVRAESTIGAPGPLDAYFPFRLGDSWTYDWKTEGRQAPPRKASRTRVFEGTEAVGGGIAYKLVSDDGTYHIYTLRNGVLSIHSSVEAGRVLYYEPPVPLFAPDLRPGEPRVTDNPDTQRTWKTTFLGFEDVTVPLGTFPGCLKVRLEMRSPEYVADSYHYFARGVGLVAYRFELLAPDGRTTELKIDARLRLARLSGVAIAQMADVQKLAAAETLDLGGHDDPSARAILRRATDNRYTWDEKFPGFRGDFAYQEPGRPPVQGSFEVDRELNVRVKAPTEAARAFVRGQISSFISHRKYNPFDLAYAGATFKKGATLPGGSLEILAEGDTMGSSYTVRKDEILSVGRSAGRLRYVANNREQLKVEDGHYITISYELIYYSNEDQSQVSVESMFDSYQKVGEYWLPTGRSETRSDHGGPASSFELRLSNLHY